MRSDSPFSIEIAIIDRSSGSNAQTSSGSRKLRNFPKDSSVEFVVLGTPGRGIYHQGVLSALCVMFILYFEQCFRGVDTVFDEFERFAYG